MFRQMCGPPFRATMYLSTARLGSSVLCTSNTTVSPQPDCSLFDSPCESDRPTSGPPLESSLLNGSNRENSILTMWNSFELPIASGQTHRHYFH